MSLVRSSLFLALVTLALGASVDAARGAEADPRPAPDTAAEADTDADASIAAAVAAESAPKLAAVVASKAPADDVSPVLIPWPLRPEPRTPGAPPPAPAPAPAPEATDDRSVPLLAPPAPPQPAAPAPTPAAPVASPVPAPRGAPPAVAVSAPAGLPDDDEPLMPLVPDRPEDPATRLAARRPGDGLPSPSLEPDEGARPAAPGRPGPRPPSGGTGPRPQPGGPVGPRPGTGEPASEEGAPGAVAPRPEGQPATGAAAAAVAAGRGGVTKTPAGPAPGTFTDSEIGLLAPRFDMPTVGAQVAITELTPPTPDVRRWQFENIEGLTWESEEAEQDGDWVILRGQVDIRSGIERIRADEVKLNTVTRRLEAEGNVVLDRLDSRLTGRRLEYDVDSNTGTVYDAMGYTADDLSFTADVAEKVGPNKYLLRGATFTSCTQPSPIWQVHATKAIVELDKFVYLWNARVAFGKVPLSYFPWVAIPIKQERTTGFMIPRIASSSRRGQSISEEFFWAINRSLDLTVGGTWWSDYGFRADGQLRWFLPGMNEYGYIEGIYLRADKDKEDPQLEPERYMVNWEHRQRMGQWDLTFTGEIATDPLVDEFAGQLTDTSTRTGVADRSPVLNQRVTLQRRWGKHSLNIELQNDERGSVQAPPTIQPQRPPDPGLTLEEDGTRTNVTRSLPFVEYRTSGLQLGGKKWASLSLEGSAGAFLRGVEDEYLWPYIDGNREVYLRFEDRLAWHDYMRADVYPQFQFPLGTSWLRVIPEVNVRGTWWSRLEKDADPATPETLDAEQRQVDLPDPPVTPPGYVSLNYGLGEDVSTFLWAWDAGVTFEGPDLERIFNVDAAPGQRKWQHVIEPSLEYSYAPEMDRDWIIRGDARASHYEQRFSDLRGTAPREGGLNEVRLRLVNTLRTKRVVPAGSTEEPARDALIWTLSSNWDLDKDQRTTLTTDGKYHDDPLDCNADGDTSDTGEGSAERCPPRTETTRFQNLTSDFNIRPTDRIHFSLRNTYDVMADDVTDTTLVGGVEGNWGYTDVSFTSRRDPRTVSTTNAEASLTGEHWFYKGDRFRLGYDITRVLDEPSTADPAASDWIYKRFVVSYFNQCIGLSLSWEDNAYRSVQREKEWMFIVSLKEVGNFIRYRNRRTVQ